MAIKPGFLTQYDAGLLNAAISDTNRIRETLELLSLPSDKEFPARITTFDSSTQRATWVEEAFAADGSRYIKDGGRYGNTTHNPAYPVGNGLLPPPAFPIQVMLRERVIHTVAGTQLGMAYEFDWVCACAGRGSGSGSGSTSTGTLVSCCPSALPTTLTVTLTASGSCATGSSGTITWNGTYWTGIIVDAVKTWTFNLFCSSGVWIADITADAGVCTGVANLLGGGTCVPFAQYFEFIANPNPVNCGVCAGLTLQFTVTE